MTRSRHLPHHQANRRERSLRLGLAVIATATIAALGFIGWLILQLVNRGPIR